jgi:predicted SAM-dependent methyltransferase
MNSQRAPSGRSTDPPHTLVQRVKGVEPQALRTTLLYARGSLHWAAAGHFIRRRRVRDYLNTHPEPRLHVGCGPLRLPGWLNTDLITGEVHLDLARPFPLPTASFAYAFGEHVIEHFSAQRGARLLSELHRVLRPGGVLRLTTPDLSKIVAIYEDRNPVVEREEYARFLAAQTGRGQERPAQVLNDYLRLWGHRFVYDEQELAAVLSRTGFVEIIRQEPGQSRHEPVRGVERHGGDPWVNRAEAMCLEATKPG